ncbi:MAG: 3-methyladenine DNA glycosylase [Gammaproteobacteria bacterium GWF2_41_13]|nr:MAG: 3-methyladenine DNA glycosylase [Gammaproteobacteria bacterium GWF2_41_13]
MLTEKFFNRDAASVAKALLGKVLRARYQSCWLSSMIIETEAYYLIDKASHASLGYTEKRKALFMPAGTIYMYYARGGDSLNVSCRGAGNAVLIKAGIPFYEGADDQAMLSIMQQLNPVKNTARLRSKEKLCSGQTLLCRSLGLFVNDWDQKPFDRSRFYIEDVAYHPTSIIQAKRLGIPKGRDEHRLLRFIDKNHVDYCTENPLKKKTQQEGRDYVYLSD